MSIIRIDHNRANPYVMLNKSVLEDPNISWAAKGLWAYLMSRPDNWEVNVQHLAKIYSGRGGGEEAIWAILKELIKNGYCERKEKPKTQNGKFSGVEYVIKEFKELLPHRSLPDPENAGNNKERSSLSEPSPSSSEFKNKRQRLKKEEVVVVSENEEKAEKASEWLRKFSVNRSEFWCIDKTDLLDLIERYGYLFFSDQLRYVTDQQMQADRDEKNVFKQRKAKPIDKPLTVLRLACEKNYANSKHKL